MEDEVKEESRRALDALRDRYDEEYGRQLNESSAWYASMEAQPKPTEYDDPNLFPSRVYNGFRVDCGCYELEIGRIVKAAYSLSDDQLAYIMGIAYEKYHAYFEEMFEGAVEIAEMLVAWSRLPSLCADQEGMRYYAIVHDNFPYRLHRCRPDSQDTEGFARNEWHRMHVEQAVWQERVLAGVAEQLTEDEAKARFPEAFKQ